MSVSLKRGELEAISIGMVGDNIGESSITCKYIILDNVIMFSSRTGGESQNSSARIGLRWHRQFWLTYVLAVLVVWEFMKISYLNNSWFTQDIFLVAFL